MPTNSKFSALFEFATEGILVINDTGKIIMANPAVLSLFGYAEKELINQRIEILIPERFAGNHSHHRNTYAENPKPRTMGIGMDLYAKKKDGSEFPVEISLSPFKDEDGSFTIAFIIDITTRKQIEDAVVHQRNELEKLTNELEKRVRNRTMILEEALHDLENSREELSAALEKEKELNELKSRFVSMASHEFRTPLATILSSLSLVNKYSELNDTTNQTKHINRIKTSVSHLTEILNDTLSISRLEEGKVLMTYTHFDLEIFIGETLQELQAIAKKGQQITYTHNGIKKIFMDIKILKQIIFNLVSNAIKFSPDNSVIEIYTQAYPSNLTLQITDNGIGIPEEDKEHMFERFFRAQNATNVQGTGLGLNIVAKFVELLKGNITFESQYGKGTTFFIKLPNKHE
ncbi:MAG: PAS domain-containing sensor histidine kinase [Bacteroidota bacterium]